MPEEHSADYPRAKMKLIVSALLLSITVFTSHTYGDEIEESYSIKEIKFSQNGFPSSVRIRLVGHLLKEHLPSQVLVSKDKTVLESLSDFKVINHEDQEKFDILEFTIDFSSYLPLEFFDPKKPAEWSFAKISGPQIKLENDVSFVTIVESKDYLIGFSVGEVSGDENVRKWKSDRLVQ